MSLASTFIHRPLAGTVVHTRNKPAAALLVLVLTLAYGSETRAQVGYCTPALGEAYLDANNVRARILNNGNLFWRGDPSVYEVPDGDGTHAVYTSGIWVGGYVGGQLRVAAARYVNFQFWAGPLDDDAAPPANCREYDRLFKVSVDDIEEYEATGAATQDMLDWPTGLGAPTLAPPGNGLDDDGDGTVDEEGEEVPFDIGVPLMQRVNRKIDLVAGERPALLGDQSIWWIMNDRGNEHRADGSDTPPIGLEVHAMAFAFNTDGDLGNTTFYKYNLYLKGTGPATDMYIGLFSDPDLGNYKDDWVGSDTVRSMGFVWNADNDDEGSDGYGVPPALGYDFLQGPLVPSPGDTAYVSGEPRPDSRNLKMTGFVYFNNLIDSTDATGDPRNGEGYYNYLSGKWRDGQPITFGGNGRDFSNDPAHFIFPGDPGESNAACQYWSECNSDGLGTNIRPSDRRFVMSSGPFTMNPGEVQQIVFGIIWARGRDNFDSVQELKRADDAVQGAYDIQFRHLSAKTEFTDFLTVANAAGRLDPPEPASLPSAGFPSSLGLGAPSRGRQQQDSNARWIFSAGASHGSFGPVWDKDSFLGRATRLGETLANLGTNDYEMRFTDRCSNGIDGSIEPTDCLGWRRYSDGALIEVPFELWDIGAGTPDDENDDIRLVPGICDTGTCQGGAVHGVFDIGRDHPVSDDDNDPATDWIDWLMPEDMSPGASGYEMFVAGEASYAFEILARTVLVSLDGGAAPPYVSDMPEPGTVFRIVTTNPDITGLEDDVSEAPNEIYLLPNYPNPFNPRTNIWFALPRASHARVTVFNVLAQRVATLVDGHLAGGFHSVRFEADGLASGLYFYHLEFQGSRLSGKMLLMK